MQRRILVDASHPEEVRVVVQENNLVIEYDHETTAKKQIKGNIYLAKVTRVEPSLQAAFIDYGNEKHGFLPFSEIHPDYYQIPVEDREKLLLENLSAEEELSIKSRQVQGATNDISYQIKAITPPEPTQDDDSLEEISENLPNSNENETNQFDGEVDVNHDLQGEDSEFLQNTTEPISEEDVEEARLRARPSNLYKRYKIQEVIKRNQIILVQAIKEERGNKGASFTSYISLAGRYCVLMPNTAGQGGVSRRIANSDDRRKIKSIIDNLGTPEGASVIIRTAGGGRTKAEIKRDYEYLVKLWNGIREHTLTAAAPAFIHAEGDLIKRIVRDLYDNTISEIQIQGEEAYRAVKDFMKVIVPGHASKVKAYKHKAPIFCRYNIEEQLSSLYNPVVHLASGGYIVFGQTEALTAIDVNSGKSTSERNIEETAVKTNLEAAREIARQLRLRDLAGLVVIDFIDMVEQRNRRLVERTMRDLLQYDRAKIQLGLISNFGLLEMSRQRLKSSFIEGNTTICQNCNGKGFTRTLDANTEMVLRTIESEVHKGNFTGAINVYAHPDVIIYMLNFKRDDIASTEKNCNVKIFFKNDNEATSDSFALEKSEYSHKIVEVPINVEPEYGELVEEEEEIIEQAEQYSYSRYDHARPISDGNLDDDLVHRSDRRTSTNYQKPRNPRRRMGTRKRLNPRTEEVNAPSSTNQTNPSVRRSKEEGNKYRNRRHHRHNQEGTATNRKTETKSSDTGSLIKGLWRKIIASK